MSDVQRNSILAGRISFFEQIANTPESVQNNNEACSNSQNTLKDQDIERIVEDFGHKLKQKRTKEKPRNTSSSSDNSDSNQLATYCQKFHEQIDSMEDMFGLNDFAEEDEENFIVESYNRPGDELIITFLEIKRINKCVDTSDGDFVIHEQEYEPYTNPEENDSIHEEDYSEEQVEELQEEKEEEEIYTDFPEIRIEPEPKLENPNIHLKNKNGDIFEYDLSYDIHNYEDFNQHYELLRITNREKIDEITNQCNNYTHKVDKNYPGTSNISDEIQSQSVDFDENATDDDVKIGDGYYSESYEQTNTLPEKNYENYLGTYNESTSNISVEIQSQSDDVDEIATDDDVNIGDGYYSESYEQSNTLPKNFASEHHKQISSLRRVVSENSNKTKLSYIVEELVETEDQYSESLRKVVENYIPFINIDIPKHLLGKTTYIFGNISRIHKASIQLSKELKKSNGDYEKIAQLFLKADKLLELYPKYSQNKPTSDIYLKEFESIIRKRQKELGDKLDLNSYLLTPIQRLGKYILLFEGIQKELQKLNKPYESINQVIEKIKKVMRMGNDNIAIDSIKRSPINLSEHGSFLAREKFNLLKPKKMESMVFLFENIIVFTQASSSNMEQFIYYDSIDVKDLTIAGFEEKELIFDLWNYTEKKKNKSLIPFTLEAKSAKIKTNWIKQIQERLWRQLQQAKESQLRDIQYNPIKINRRSGNSRIPRAVHNSVFYVEDN